MRHLFVLTASCAALVVAACSNPAEKTAETADTAPAADARVGETITMADLPPRRAGIWRNTMTNPDGSTEIVRQCFGENEPVELMGKDGGCEPTLRRVANGVSVSGQCTDNGMTTTISGTLTGDYQTRTAMDLNMKATMEGKEVFDMRLRGESVYEGPCAAGQEPGVIQDQDEE